MAHKDPTKRREYQRAYLRANKCVQEQKRRDRVFGAGAAQYYDAQKARQNNCCAICGRSGETLSAALSLDHDHSDGQWRGLLCNFCNRVLGYLENKTWLHNANKYLAEWQDRKRGLRDFTTGDK